MKVSGLALAALVCLVWGFNAVAIKVGVDYMPPLFFTTLRFALVLICLAPWIRPVPRDQWGTLAGAVFFMGALHFALIFIGTQLSSASIMAIVDQLYVPFAVLLAMFWLGERVTWLRWTGIGVALMGVVIFSFEGNVAEHWDGVLFLIADALSMAIGTVLLRRLVGVPPLVMQAWMCVQGLPLLAIATLLLESGQIASAATAPWQAWAALIFTVIGGSLIGHTGYYVLLQRYEVSLVASMLLVSPVISVLAGVVMLGEPFTLQIAVGALLALAGVGIVLKRTQISTVEPIEGV